MARRLFGALVALVLLLPTAAPAIEGLHLGDRAPGFTLPRIGGGELSLDALGERTRVILFWATWSPRSLEALGDLRALHEQWGAEGLEIVAVNADGERLDAARAQAVRERIERLGLPFPVLLDADLGTYAAYGVLALPSAVVVDAGGRIAYVLGGYPETLREELKENIRLALGERPAPAEEAPATACSIPRAYYCSMAAEQARGTADAAVMALRLSICRGDTAKAERLLQEVSREARWSGELSFAQGNLLLLKGRTQEARMIFSMLRGTHPAEGWGEWGLGMAALAEHDAERAFGYLRAAGARGAALPEAQTAVLRYLEPFWRERQAAPREEQFIALFRDLDGIRSCYRKSGARG